MDINFILFKKLIFEMNKENAYIVGISLLNNYNVKKSVLKRDLLNCKIYLINGGAK